MGSLKTAAVPSLIALVALLGMACSGSDEPDAANAAASDTPSEADTGQAGASAPDGIIRQRFP